MKEYNRPGEPVSLNAVSLRGFDVVAVVPSLVQGGQFPLCGLPDKVFIIAYEQALKIIHRFLPKSQTPHIPNYL